MSRLFAIAILLSSKNYLHAANVSSDELLITHSVFATLSDCTSLPMHASYAPHHHVFRQQHFQSKVQPCRPPARHCSKHISRSYRAADDPVVTTDWLAQHLEEVTVLDVRGQVDTVTVEEGVEKSEYLAGYDAYLEGHIPVSVA
jgi:hypothetical protein